MRAKLSARSIQTLRPGDKPFEVVDADLKGFLLRVQPSGAMTYYFSYRNGHGRRKRCRIGNSDCPCLPKAAQALSRRISP